MTVLVGYAGAHGLDTEVHALQPHREAGAYDALTRSPAIRCGCSAPA